MNLFISSTQHKSCHRSECTLLYMVYRGWKLIDSDVAVYRTEQSWLLATEVAQLDTRIGKDV
jgi:hypothetical protein